MTTTIMVNDNLYKGWGTFFIVKLLLRNLLTNVLNICSFVDDPMKEADCNSPLKKNFKMHLTTN